MWGDVSNDVGEARERVLAASIFKPVLDKGAQLTRHHDTPSSAYAIVRRIVEGQSNEFPHEDRNPPDTGSSKSFEERFEEHTRRCQEEMKRMQEDMLQAFKRMEAENQRRFEEEAHKLREWTEMKLEQIALDFHRERRSSRM